VIADEHAAKTVDRRNRRGGQEGDCLHPLSGSRIQGQPNAIAHLCSRFFP
jgi:hypothetical protein